MDGKGHLASTTRKAAPAGQHVKLCAVLKTQHGGRPPTQRHKELHEVAPAFTEGTGHGCLPMQCQQHNGTQWHTMAHNGTQWHTMAHNGTRIPETGDQANT